MIVTSRINLSMRPRDTDSALEGCGLYIVPKEAAQLAPEGSKYFAEGIGLHMCPGHF